MNKQIEFPNSSLHGHQKALDRLKMFIFDLGIFLDIGKSIRTIVSLGNFLTFGGGRRRKNCLPWPHAGGIYTVRGNPMSLTGQRGFAMKIVVE